MKPIQFSTEMVCAISDGRKTVTRRVCKDASKYDIPQNEFIDFNTRTYAIRGVDDGGNTTYLAERPMPYSTGDILWVRETFFREECTPDCAGQSDPDECVFNRVGDFCYGYKAQYVDGTWKGIKWRPSIHMPREAARIFLRVKSVRVERLRDISNADVIREGCIPKWRQDGCNCNARFDGCMLMPCANRDAYESECYTMPFAELWDSTVKSEEPEKYSWNANPWVWVIEFERCEKPEASPQC